MMRKRHSAIVGRLRAAALFSMLLASGVCAATPVRVEIAYDVLRNGTAVGEIVTRLEHDGRSYRISETWKGK